jgi:hypothetical protein
MFKLSPPAGAGRSRRTPANWLLGLALLLVPGMAGAAELESAGSRAAAVTMLQPPEGAKVFSMSLAVGETPSGGRSHGYLAQRSSEPLEELASVPPAIAQAYAGKEFSVYQIGALANRTRYLVALNEDSGVKFLNQHESPMWYARIYRLHGEGDPNPVLLREGFQSMSGDVTIPAELESPGIGATKVKSMRTEVGYSINGTQNGKPQVYSGRGTALQVAGSQQTHDGKLTLAVTVPEELTVTPDTQVFLRFEPVAPGLPERTASGKITDFLTLGSARFAVTALAPDFSSASVAIVAGSLEQTLKQELRLGTQMPSFAQVDLVSRRTLAREDVLARARKGTGVVFVFGDLPSSGGRFGNPYEPPYRPGGSITLPLRPEETAEQLGTQLEPKPLLVVVARQISMNYLYEDLRNKTPEYLVLSDFVDPLRMTFRVPQTNPGGWYGPSFPGGQDPSLRQLFNLPVSTISVAAFDSQGKVLYVKADAGSSFLPTLAEARASLAGGKTGK